MSETQEWYTGRSYQEGDRVTIVKHGSPLYRQIGTIQQVRHDWYHVLVDGSSFNVWYQAGDLVLFAPPPRLLTQQELLFAQMRGILLHLNERGWDRQQWGSIENGADAMEVWFGYVAQGGYESLHNQLVAMPNHYRLFIDYWDSFLIEDDDEEDVGEEPDMSDDFPLSLEYDDDNPGTIALESMLESGEEYAEYGE